MSAPRCGCRILRDRWGHKKFCLSPCILILTPIGYHCALEGNTEDPAGEDTLETAVLFTFGSLKELCFLADVNECMDPSSCPTGRCVNTLGSYQCVSCGVGYQPRNGKCIGEKFELTLGSTLAPHNSTPCKPQKEQGHRQHPFTAVSQPVCQGILHS